MAFGEEKPPEVWEKKISARWKVKREELLRERRHGYSHSASIRLIKKRESQAYKKKIKPLTKTRGRKNQVNQAKQYPH